MLIAGVRNWQKREGQAAVSALFAAFPHTVPLTCYIAVGVIYGMLMQSKGYGAFWSALMSAVAFCGSMQFVAITLLTTLFNPVQAFLLSFLVNARYLFYGISMLDKYKGLGKIRGFLIYFLCDEIFSICYAQEPPAGVSRKHFFFFMSFLPYCYWVAGTFLGGILGNYATLDLTGFDFAMTALFAILFMDQWKDAKNRRPALVGIGCSVASLAIFGQNHFIIPAMALMLATVTMGRQKLCA